MRASPWLRTHRKVGFLLTALALLSWAPTAQAGPHRAECRRLTRQIAHYEDVAAMADERDDERWLAGTNDHIDRLAERRVRLCPEYRQENPAVVMARWLADTAKKAGQAFLRYLTFGALGA